MKIQKFLLLLFICSSLQAATYYVDQTAGSDAAAGTTGVPWKNCPGMTGTALYTGGGSLTAGDTVYLDRNDVWLVQDAGATPGFDLEGGVHYIGDEWDPEAGGANMATIRAEARCEAGVVRFFEDHPTFETIFEGFEVDGNGYRANGIEFMHRYWVAGGLQGATKRILDCEVHDNDGNGGGGDYRYGIIASDNSGGGATNAVENVEIINTYVHNVPREAIAIYPGTGGQVNNVLVRGCTVTATGEDTSYVEGSGLVAKGDVNNCVFEYNYSYATQAAAVFINADENEVDSGPNNLTVRHNILSTTANDGIIRFYGNSPKSADIYGNICIQNTISGGIELEGNAGTLTLNVYNNTLYNCWMNFDGEIAVARNNIVIPVSGTAIRTATNVTQSNNITSAALFKNTGNLPNGWSGAYPNFVPNNDGLESRSLATLDLGNDLGTSFNTSINSSTRPVGRFDIGAYDNGSKVTYISAARADWVAFEADVDTRNEDDWIAYVDESSVATWTGSMTIDCGQTISIRGSGARGTGPNWGAGATAPEITWSGNVGLSVVAAPNKTIWLDNIEFKHTGTQQYSAVGLTGDGINTYRFSYLTFNDIGADVNIRVLDANQTGSGDGPWGLVDHLYMVQSAADNGFYIYHATNHDQWDTDMTWGTVETLTIETSMFEYTGTEIIPGAPALDASYAGARYMARYCFFDRWLVVLHGADSAPTSTMQMEFHHNTITVDDNADYGVYIRGGAGMATDNTFAVTGIGEYNSGFKTVKDGPGVYPGFQQVGRGTVGGVETTVGWYIWGNNYDPGDFGIGFVTTEHPSFIQENRDYWLSAPGAGKPITSYTELAYPHPLIAATEGEAPAGTTINVGTLLIGANP